MPTSVSVTIVTYNSRAYLEACLQSIFEQDYQPLEIVVVDNGSLDGTRGFLSRLEDRIRVEYNDTNLGFAAAQNQAIAKSTGDWVLVLNPDVVLLPGVIEHLVEAGRIDEKAGTICGRLLAIGRDLKPLEQPLIDTAGIYFTEAMRHFDRGWHEPDDGRFRKMEYVFGASAAAALYRREMIADISENVNFFDPDFFHYREDADVAWRAQLLGWRCLYTPEQPSEGSRSDQHALGQEPLPHAHQEHDRGRVPAVLAADDRARLAGDGRRFVDRTEVAAGVLEAGQMPAGGVAEPPLDHEPAPGQR
jgi:GT2 family glycosyltransferase